MNHQEIRKNNHVVIVTGASGGIGSATVRTFTREGCHVIATARNTEKLRALQSETGCDYLAGDIRDADFVHSLFGFAETKGQISTLINNAAISHIGVLQDMSVDEWDNLISTNLRSVFLTCREAIPFFLHQGGGSVVNVSSVWGNVGASCEVAYSASKGGINAFTKALAKELAPSHIRVNAAAFGAIDTPMNGFLQPDERTELEEEIGMGRFGTPEEAAALIVDLALHHPYLTGQIVTMDGAWY